MLSALKHMRAHTQTHALAQRRILTVTEEKKRRRAAGK